MIYFVFDVESIGLHGEGFAVGFQVVDETGKHLDCGRYACPSIIAKGSKESHTWVEEHIPNFFVHNESTLQTRQQFWTKWLEWKEKGALLFADCAWPVEARFLCACVDDHIQQREWQGPYPLHDVATVLLTKGMNPLAKYPRTELELPEHDPLKDAQQSARLLIEALKK